MSSAATSAASNAASIAINAAITAAVQQQRDALIAHFTGHQALSPQSAIAADSIDHALHAPLKYYRDNGVIRDAGADRLYLDLDVLAGLKAKAKRTGRNVLITVMVLAVLVAAVVVVLATW
ncbi:hypothetical protein ABE424_10765 [Stenotrophomonas sp. TWI1149]|uniref:hypothetical protein n=1 Tax=unclassified Stenotrophomonas TaxID=196198 RepID=UPI00320B7055